MTFSVRAFEEGDYLEAKSWLNQKNVEAPPFADLPARGYMVTNGGINCSLGFLHEVLPTECAITHMVANPMVEDEKRSASVDFLVDHLVEVAKTSGYKKVHATTNKKKLIGRFLEREFSVYAANMTHVSRAL